VNEVCKAEGCDGRAVARGWCSKHYSRWQRHGDALREAPAPAAKTCSVEGCDVKAVARGLCHTHYCRLRKTGTLAIVPPVRVNGGECAVEGCPKTAQARGLCSAHYERWKKYGDPLGSAEPKTGIPCSIDGCKGLVIAKGLCGAHYGRLQKHGDPTEYSDWYKRRFQPIVNEHGYVEVYAPSHPNAGKGGRIPEHRFVMSRFLGRPLLPGENVHHKNGCKTDNRLENLELWVTTQPQGQRPEDLIPWAREILARYEDKFAA
jgi:hypothetical protein